MTEKCTKARRLIETKVVIEPHENAQPWWTWNKLKGQEREEAIARWLEKWASEVFDFFRDHRHQDVNSVHVERTYQEQCSSCHREWEEMVDDDTGETCCAWCGVPMEVVQ